MRATGASRSDLDTELAASGGHRLGDRAHPSHHVAVEALDPVVAAGEQVEQQAEGGARLA